MVSDCNIFNNKRIDLSIILVYNNGRNNISNITLGEAYELYTAV